MKYPDIPPKTYLSIPGSLPVLVKFGFDVDFAVSSSLEFGMGLVCRLSSEFGSLCSFFVPSVVPTCLIFSIGYELVVVLQFLKQFVPILSPGESVLAPGAQC
jgi:hypothetical protein